MCGPPPLLLSKLIDGSPTIATDYDAPRHPTEDVEAAATIGAVATRHAENVHAQAEEPDPFEAELDTLDADLAGEELTVRVLPKQANEFTCTRCYLVHHHSQLGDSAKLICRDCA